MPVWMEASFCNYFIRLNAALPPSAPEQEMVVLHQLLGQRPSLAGRFKRPDMKAYAANGLRDWHGALYVTFL